MVETKHLVMARTEKGQLEGVETSKGRIHFPDNSSAMHVSADIANEIHHTQGVKGTGDVWVQEDPRLNHHNKYTEGIHNYYFGATKKYADAWEEFEKRRIDK